VNYDAEALKKIPRTGALVVVANHPYGVLDGLIITQLMKRVRPDFRVLTNSVLCRAPEAADDLLPIDFAETAEALEVNLATRKKARDILRNGGCIVVFPAGGVSTIPTLKDKVAQDTTWQPFIGRLIQESRADVVPVFFEGQNSRLFQIVSLFSSTLRLALFFKEVADKIGAKIGVRIGEVIPYTILAEYTDRVTLCHNLRERTYALGGMTTLPPPKAAYRINPKSKPSAT
jgi:putative hemolysin